VWDDIPAAMPTTGGRRVDLDTLTHDEVQSWKAGELLLLSCKLLTGRDAAHKRMVETLTLLPSVGPLSQ
jgi:fumarate hydratase class I